MMRIAVALAALAALTAPQPTNQRPWLIAHRGVLLQSFTASSPQFLAAAGTKRPVHALVSAKDAPHGLIGACE